MRFSMSCKMSILSITILLTMFLGVGAFQRDIPRRFMMKKAMKIVDDAEEYQVTSADNINFKVRTEAGAKIERSPSLVLNADYTPLSHFPLSLWSWQDTLRAVFSGKAVVVSEYSNLIVRSVSCSFPLPSVIALKTYQKVPNQVPVMSRRNLYIRDGFKCQVITI